MKYFVLLIILFTSCNEKSVCDGFSWETIEPYYNENTNYVLEVQYLYPNKIELERYVNETFFNRHDIFIKLVDDAPLQIIVVENKDARGCLQTNTIEIRKDRLFTATVAHEISHRLWLQHVINRKYQHVMYPGVSSCGHRYFFTEDQVKLMKERILKDKNL